VEGEEDEGRYGEGEGQLRSDVAENVVVAFAREWGTGGREEERTDVAACV